ncbi:UDP-N-acetylmuramoyl-L-alanyl-D-glutamate--2,6-diaminopimelate ligase [Echinimonas agarilytica]|uniref:UDP-N-acetylmuramoyl-L-alanyl-D-glutamate--2,6-diaminopimelate ligase n=1 Tax=Echinimonas agarilytica TaxID=1215918 RepID=A0AA42B6K4_9GAMM|nr:UDP-N-acetylmuramoyl-L-alanyl-D-glutamate--2,6-diaminopimelate ligase [Echinimonas agarilytica]MCM2678774.1 UDP-N-acetylmuramoyl-L-alanyl-D-glutamate--2,6-diaminopimelate ligase [Echinimonas agarilytica]
MSKRLRDIVKPWGLSARVADVEARNLIIDSRQVSHGDIFVALRGHVLDGRDFIEAAICQGACAVLIDAEQAHVDDYWSVPVVELTQLPERLGEVAARFYDVTPGAPTVVGITGTNGKTSVSHYMANLLKLLKTPAGVIGTLGYGDTNALIELPNTTPDALSVHRLLSEQFVQGKSWVTMEVSSHGLVQNRVASVPFKHAVLTNLSRDHLDYHGTMEAYGEAKAALFDWPNLSSSTINYDDAFGRRLLNSADPQTTVVYGLDNCAEIRSFPHWLTLIEICPEAAGFSAKLDSSWGLIDVTIPLLGRFNLSNVLASIGPLLMSGFHLNEVAHAVAQLKPVAGRMESFSQPTQPVCIVDYAHTSDALSEALKAARFHCKGQLWCVFGCGGDRDVGKRPLMAEAAQLSADRIIVTSDNPRSESQHKIAEDILKGFSSEQNVHVINDRHQAIQAAIREADAQDVVLIAGKGHESYQLIGDLRLHFSDREVVVNLLESEANS